MQILKSSLTELITCYHTSNTELITALKELYAQEPVRSLTESDLLPDVIVAALIALARLQPRTAETIPLLDTLQTIVDRQWYTGENAAAKKVAAFGIFSSLPSLIKQKIFEWVNVGNTGSQHQTSLSAESSRTRSVLPVALWPNYVVLSRSIFQICTEDNAANTFLMQVMCGEQKNVALLQNAHPWVTRYKGIAKDRGRRTMQATGLQYGLWSGDADMVTRIKRTMPQTEIDRQVAELINNGLGEKIDGQMGCYGIQYDYNPLRIAYKNYSEYATKCQERSTFTQIEENVLRNLLHEFIKEQGLAPVWVWQVLCRPEISLAEDNFNTSRGATQGFFSRSLQLDDGKHIHAYRGSNRTFGASFGLLRVYGGVEQIPGKAFDEFDLWYVGPLVTADWVTLSCILELNQQKLAWAFPFTKPISQPSSPSATSVQSAVPVAPHFPPVAPVSPLVPQPILVVDESHDDLYSPS